MNFFYLFDFASFFAWTFLNFLPHCAGPTYAALWQNPKSLIWGTRPIIMTIYLQPPYPSPETGPILSHRVLDNRAALFPQGHLNQCIHPEIGVF